MTTDNGIRSGDEQPMGVLKINDVLEENHQRRNHTGVKTTIEDANNFADKNTTNEASRFSGRTMLETNFVRIGIRRKADE